MPNYHRRYALRVSAARNEWFKRDNEDDLEHPL